MKWKLIFICSLKDLSTYKTAKLMAGKSFSKIM